MTVDAIIAALRALEEYTYYVHPISAKAQFMRNEVLRITPPIINLTHIWWLGSDLKDDMVARVATMPYEGRREIIRGALERLDALHDAIGAIE